MAELSDNTNWFETDASNNKSSPNGWPEGMMPSGVNDSARGDKGALKRFWDRINPVQGITPSGGVYTFVTSNTAYPASYFTGEIYTFATAVASVGGDQFQINSLGPKPIWKVIASNSFTPILPGDISAGLDPVLVYASSLNGGTGAFLLSNPFVPVFGNGTGGVSTSGELYLSSGASSGYDWHNYASTLLMSLNGVSGNLATLGNIAGNAITANASGTAFYAPSGDVVCQNITTAGTGGSGGVSIHCTSGAVQSDHFGTAFYAPNGDLVAQNVTAGVQGYKPGGGSWAAISDVRLKQDIQDYETGLNAILALRPVTYAFNGKGGTVCDGERYVGLIADEVLPVMPEMVGTMSAMLNPDDTSPSKIKTLDTTALIFALVNCCQELAARVASLEANVRD